jgi:hypothetical protein
MSYLMIIGFVAMAGLGTLWQIAEGRLDREQKARAVAEASVKSFAAGLTQCRAEIAERNRFVTDAMALPEVRKRLCAQRAPTDACCKAPPKPPEGDECKP